jgi:four helix bundle protein
MSEYVFPFEKLKAWQASRTLVLAVYRLSEQFPGHEQFGLASQIKRAAVSVASNLAEGTSRSSLKDQAHFSQLAFSSLMEVVCQVTLAADLGYVADEDMGSVRGEIASLAHGINALRRSQLNRKASPGNCRSAR